jgi:N-acetylglucosaminyl-diphospho-decaprenol L-rhamnosyltransferase
MMISEKQSYKKLTIIIVNFRSERYIEKCIASVCNWAGENEIEIIIINNDPHEKLEVARSKFPKVVFFETGRNLGFGKAANLGAKKARGDIIFFLNPDAEILSGSLQEVTGMLRKDSGLGIIGARLEDEKKGVQEWIAGQETGFLDIILNNLGCPKSRSFWISQEPVRVDWVSAGAMMLRKEDFLEIGGFDENFFMYFEDMDLSKRMRGTGKKIIYYPKLTIFHHSGKSYSGDNLAQKRHYYASQECYFKKHRNVLEGLIIKILRKIFL